jgi:hypothetical protein
VHALMIRREQLLEAEIARALPRDDAMTFLHGRLAGAGFGRWPVVRR